MDSKDLYIISDINDPYAILAVEDPVRPTIPLEERLEPGKEIIMLMKNGTPAAVVCVSYQDSIPTTEHELQGNINGKIAVFYTIWSYVPGSGKILIKTAKNWIKDNKATVERFVTLSPKTEVAEKFHLSNKAFILSTNETSINYEYSREP